jgi:hypothetical protein
LNGGAFLCNQCGCRYTADQVLAVPVTVVIGESCCVDAAAVFKERNRRHVQTVGNEERCVACGRQSGHRVSEPMPRGIKRDYMRYGGFALRGPNSKNKSRNR